MANFKIENKRDYHLISLYLYGYANLITSEKGRDRLTFLIMSIPYDELRDAAIYVTQNPF